ncbi:MAG: hypothetical protein ACFFD4_38645 [Candidatus Odinarchaeota archaeon]
MTQLVFSVISGGRCVTSCVKRSRPRLKNVNSWFSMNGNFERNIAFANGIYSAPYVVSAESPSTVFRKTPIGKKNKVLFEESDHCYTSNYLDTGIQSVRFAIERRESGIFLVTRSSDELEDDRYRNEKWIELRIIDGLVLKNTLQDEKWAMEVISILQSPFTKVYERFSKATLGSVIQQLLPRSLRKELYS